MRHTFTSSHEPHAGEVFSNGDVAADLRIRYCCAASQLSYYLRLRAICLYVCTTVSRFIAMILAGMFASGM